MRLYLKGDHLSYFIAQILSDDLYLAYYEETKDAAQQRIWTFYQAIMISIFNYHNNQGVNK